jgi:glutaredoxin 3
MLIPGLQPGLGCYALSGLLYTSSSGLYFEKLDYRVVRNPNDVCIDNNVEYKLSLLMKKSVFYHAGCPVCVSAEHDIIGLIGAQNVEIVHLGEQKARIGEAETAGIKSVPALVTPNGNVLHINFGASMADVKG